MPPMLLHHLDLRSVTDHLHSSALCSIRLNVRKAQLAFAAEPGNFNCSAKSPVIWLTRKPATGVAFTSRQPLR